MNKFILKPKTQHEKWNIKTMIIIITDIAIGEFSQHIKHSLDQGSEEQSNWITHTDTFRYTIHSITPHDHDQLRHKAKEASL